MKRFIFIVFCIFLIFSFLFNCNLPMGNSGGGGGGDSDEGSIEENPTSLKPWAWISGNDSVNQQGRYGTKGTPDLANIPGARNSCITWIDSSGNLWLFGGYGLDDWGSVGNLNDLWKFDGINWTWISGNNFRNHAGTYGTKGTPDPSNIPGARYESISWIDSSNNLWLFGGTYYNDSSDIFYYFNDLWKFDGTNWTWVSGSNIEDEMGIYGTKGNPDPANIPGARSAGISWIDSSGNFWLFGGIGFDSLGGLWGYLNDLWKFDGTNWTWVSGSDIIDQIGNYGIKGIPDATNIPGSRWGSISWIDSSGNLWLFGGYGYDSPGDSDKLNDLWKFDGINWTWISGSNIINKNGIYGTMGNPDSANIPGSRWGSISWIDSSGNLWLFGGCGYDSVGNENYLNDLWKFDGSNWIWMAGSTKTNQKGYYGTKGTSNTTNVPGARTYSISWIDSSGNLWLFGGSGDDSAGNLGFLNDLWKCEL